MKTKRRQRGEEGKENRVRMKRDGAWCVCVCVDGGLIQLGLLEIPAVGRQTCFWLMGSAAVALRS